MAIKIYAEEGGVGELAKGYRPGGGTHINKLTIWVCATVEDMVFKPFCQEQGIENTML